MELKQNAISLRQQGYTYPEISKALGVSVDWCKKNLRGVEKSGKVDDCMKELILLATRPQGVLGYEANGVIYKHHQNASKDKIRYMKQRIKEVEPKCLIHSGWIDYMKPTESHNSMNAFVLHLMDHLDMMVEDYTDMYPNSNKWAVKYEMLKLAFSDKISYEPLSTRLLRNETLSEHLSDRLSE